MGSFVNGLKKLFGSKEERDMKAVAPILDKVLEEYKRVDALSDDDLRAETQKIKKVILDRIAPDEGKKRELRNKLEDVTISADDKEQCATEIDKLAKQIDEEIEDVLNGVLPVAFAIMKSTARRFKENATIKVKANDFDRELSTHADFVKIDGDYAIWKNHWMAGGNEITWYMVLYDVQLIGGIVLHQGKIAEM
ncbi:MAG: preprotein translocase subunit SecA, partial [Bacteroidales bacterium]|nr:preprotein translocase subunit SecA [Bacteroidales bacterium]